MTTNDFIEFSTISLVVVIFVVLFRERLEFFVFSDSNLSPARLLQCQTIRVDFSLIFCIKNYFLFTHRPISRLKKNNRAKKELAQRLSTNTFVRLLRVRWCCSGTQQKCKVKYTKIFLLKHARCQCIFDQHSHPKYSHIMQCFVLLVSECADVCVRK